MASNNQNIRWTLTPKWSEQFPLKLVLGLQRVSIRGLISTPSTFQSVAADIENRLTELSADDCLLCMPGSHAQLSQRLRGHEHPEPNRLTCVKWTGCVWASKWLRKWYLPCTVLIRVLAKTTCFPIWFSLRTSWAERSLEQYVQFISWHSPRFFYLPPLIFFCLSVFLHICSPVCIPCIGVYCHSVSRIHSFYFTVHHGEKIVVIVVHPHVWHPLLMVLTFASCGTRSQSVHHCCCAFLVGS